MSAIATGLSSSLFFLVLVVLLRMVVRRVWVADILAAVLTALSGAVDYSNPSHFALTATAVALAVYGNLWVLRRFGLLAFVATWYMNAMRLLVEAPASWYGARVLVEGAIPVTIAAWALWVILSAQRRPATEAGGSG